MAAIEYMGLSYYTSPVTEENINIGVMFHVLDTDERVFNSIKNFRRFHAFDDEVDLDMLQSLLEDIRSEIQSDLFNNNEAFSLEDYRKSFVNNFRFTEVSRKNTDNPSDFIRSMTAIYLRLDFNKSERLPRKSVVSEFKRLMRSGGIEYSTEPIDDEIGLPIPYDFVTGGIGYKFIDFEDKDPKRMVSSMRAWSQISSMDTPVKTVFILEEEPEKESEYAKLVSLLRINGEVLTNDTYTNRLLNRAADKSTQLTM